MARYADLVNELSKFKKDVLIDIIVEGCVPSNIQMSEELKNHIKVLNEGKGNVPTEVAAVSTHNLKNGAELSEVQNELKMVKRELEYAKTTIDILQTTVKDKELIINLLQESRQTTNINCGVAKSNTNSVEKVQTEHEDHVQTDAASNQTVEHTTSTYSKVASRSHKDFSAKKRNSKTDKVIGSATSKVSEEAENNSQSLFSSAPKRALIHLGKVSLNTKKETIERYLHDTFGKRDYFVEPCPVRENAKSMSFKIEADYSLLNELYTSSNWPTGVTVTRYKLFRRGDTKQFGKEN